MQIVDHLDKETWKAFVDNHPQGNIFHTPEMFDVFTRTKCYTPGVWATLGSDGQLLAIFLPVRITMLNRLFHPFTARAVSYGSVLCAPGPEGQQALAMLLRTYNHEIKNGLLFTELRNQSDLSGLQPLLGECSFAYEAHLNFLIKLDRPIQEIWQDIRSNARRNVQKARRSEVVIEEVFDLDTLSPAYTLLKDVYKRIEVPLPDLSLFKSALEVLQPRGMLQILLAKMKDKIIGVLTLLFYKGIIYYWYTGTLREYAAYRAADMLVWHTLELGNRCGFHTFDFGGGGRPDEPYGVRDFKAKFGGGLVNFGRNICIHSPVRLKVSQKGYQLARRFL